MGNDSWAPIAVFIYKRPDHARRMIESLQGCTGFADSSVYVFADGPRHSSEIPAIQRTRLEVRRLLGDQATYLERSSNAGVDASILGGVTQLCEQHGRVIVVEDDLVLSPYFLEFMNASLARYGDESRVMQVCGYMFDVPELRASHDAFFLPMTSSWGWATWKRSWDLFDPLASGWEQLFRDVAMSRRFDLDGNFKYTRMLSRQMRRPVPAWDIRWYYTVFVRDGLALCPPRTLVRNEGFDGSGTHSRRIISARQIDLQTCEQLLLPTRIAPSQHMGEVFKAVGAYRSASPRQTLVAIVKALANLRARR